MFFHVNIAKCKRAPIETAAFLLFKNQVYDKELVEIFSLSLSLSIYIYIDLDPFFETKFFMKAPFNVKRFTTFVNMLFFMQRIWFMYLFDQLISVSTHLFLELNKK